MPRMPQTKEQIANRVIKGQATKAANKAAALAMIGEQSKPKSKYKYKPKAKRAPEVIAAATERLAIAREARGPSQNLMIDESVRLLPDDSIFSLKNVREWIKINKDLLGSMRGMKQSKDANDRGAVNNIEAYVANLESYLRTGAYTDTRYGSSAQNKVVYVCRAMAYHKDGKPKRSVGTIYPDLGMYTQEMFEYDTVSRK